MDRHWLIIADDLTGAADSAIAFAKRRLPARVSWGEPRADESADSIAMSFDADSRHLPAAAGARRHAEVLQRMHDGRSRVFKKIDSTLRGNPAEEIGALLDLLGARLRTLPAVFAPAFPAGGRVTRNGRVFVHGRPLELTEFWNDARPGEHADVVTLLESAGLRVRHVPLEQVRAGFARLRGVFAESTGAGALCFCDAETGEDLEHIAAAGLADPDTFFAGSAGLAHALAAQVSRAAGQRVTSIEHGASSRGALFVIGSQAGATRDALASLHAMPRLRALSVSAGLLLGELPGALPLVDLERDLDAGVDVVVDVTPDASRAPSPRVVESLARQLAPLARRASALMATGGDTASACLARCGVRGLRLVDELEPGISLGLTLGELSLPVVTRSGGFGDPGTLRRIAERLRFIRRTGTVA